MDTFKQYLMAYLNEAKQTRVIIMGGPGSGKSTYSEYITRHFSIKHIYPGGLLRKEIDKGGPDGQMIKDLLDKGKFAPNDIVLKLVKNALTEKDASKGYVLDGYPRYMQQVRDMEKNSINYDVVVYLDVSKEEVIRRLTKRGRKDDSQILLLIESISTTKKPDRRLNTTEKNQVSFLSKLKEKKQAILRKIL